MFISLIVFFIPVYPLLSREQQSEFEEIEKSLYHEELTMQGYQKSRRQLFTRVGLLVPLEQDVKKNVKAPSQEQKSKDTVSATFKSKDECSEVKHFSCLIALQLADSIFFLILFLLIFFSYTFSFLFSRLFLIFLFPGLREASV
jgi:hypothetical protein